MKDIKAIRGKYYIQKLIEEGEHEHQDFKFAISDARKIARSISAFANNDGGRLLVGVKDNGRIAGVRNEEDIYVIEQAAGMYCLPAQHVDITAFVCEGGAVVIRADIPRAERRPVFCREAGNVNRAYYRVDDENMVAHPLMVRAWQLMADGTSGGVVSFSEPESLLLDMLDREEESVTPESFARAARISLSTASDVIVRLAALDVVRFVHFGGAFRLVRS